MIRRLCAWLIGDWAFDALLRENARLRAERDDLDEALDRACVKIAQWERIAVDLRRQRDEERAVRFGVVGGAADELAIRPLRVGRRRESLDGLFANAAGGWLVREIAEPVLDALAFQRRGGTDEPQDLDIQLDGDVAGVLLFRFRHEDCSDAHWKPSLR